MCGFIQISLILLCILLKLDFLDLVHVSFVVLGLSVVGALAYFNSLKYRCITNLMTMLFLGRSGRALLITLLLTIVISGVVHNLWTNSVEMLRVFVCTTMIHIRLAKMKFELLTTPFLHHFDGAVDSKRQLQTEVERMTAFVLPAVEAVENPDPGFSPTNTSGAHTQPKDPKNVTGWQYVEDYRHKLYVQCLYQIEESQRVCSQNYSQLYGECVDRVVLIKQYCNDFRVDKYCSPGRILAGATPEDFCDTAGVIPGQMGDSYRNLMLNRDRMETARMQGNVSYNITNLPTLPGMEEIKEAAAEIKRRMMRKKQFIDALLYLLSVFDVLILIQLVHKTLSYYRHYTMDIEYDNIYLNDELRDIDMQRVVSGRPSVLPLKHFEQEFYVDPMLKKLRQREWLSISYNLLYVALIVLGVSGLFLVDWIYYTGLLVVRDNAMVNFTQSGSFNFTLTVNGSGLLARIIRNATQGMNVSEFQSINETNAKCLPNATLTDWRSYLHVYLLAALILYMNVNLMYSQRMMSVICGHFFPKKHEMRIKYLYNQMLIRRRIYFEEGLLNILGQEDIVSRAHTLDRVGMDEQFGGEPDGPQKKRWAEKLFAWCKRTWQVVVLGKICRREPPKEDVICTVCLERENTAVTGQFQPCGFEKCVFRYCSSCWRHLDHHCVVYYADKGKLKHLNNRLPNEEL